jgi:hypothetical protein
MPQTGFVQSDGKLSIFAYLFLKMKALNWIVEYLSLESLSEAKRLVRKSGSAKTP